MSTIASTREQESLDSSGMEAIDLRMMERCIALSGTAIAEGEFPFAALICSRDGNVVVETTNRVVRDRDITRHAELLAISEAQKILGQTGLADCMLYSTVEPCAMCSFPMRESRISRVVYSITSPIMGGFSRWNVLGDEKVSAHMPEYFGKPPEVIAGLLAKDAEKVWLDWSPGIWEIITTRGCFEVFYSHADHVAAHR